MPKEDYMVRDKNTTDKTLVGWSNRLRKLGLKDAASSYTTDIVKDFHLLHRLGLPTYDSYMIHVTQFISEFNEFRKKFIHSRYYLILFPMLENYRKYVLMDFCSLFEAKEFIKQNINGLYDLYMLRISEFKQNIYGGSIISNNGSIVVEMTKGVQNGVAYGTSNVISGILTTLSVSTRYSTNDEIERLCIWRAMQGIRRDNQAVLEDSLNGIETHKIRNFFFLKGYFEFVYVKHTVQDSLRLIFFDVKLNKAYFNINHLDFYI